MCRGPVGNEFLGVTEHGYLYRGAGNVVLLWLPALFLRHKTEDGLQKSMCAEVNTSCKPCNDKRDIIDKKKLFRACSVCLESPALVIVCIVKVFH